MAKRRTLLMRLLSRAVRLTPNTVYYPESLEVGLRNSLERMEMSRSGEGDALRPAVLAVAIAAAHKLPEVGDFAISTIHGATRRGQDVGSFRVYVERISDEEGANG